MRVYVHRGQDQIGGSIIEIASETTRIVFDVGSELDETVPAAPHVEGLFSGTPAFDAVFLSHYHGDHLGLCEQVLPDIPIYIGKGAGAVANAARRYLNKAEYRFSAYYEAGKSITIGDISVTPYLCDHSAFDAYMFHVSCGEQSVLYSGDFRTNGRKSFAALLRRLPKAELLIVEGTTLSREAVRPLSEAQLEQLAVDRIAQTDAPVFVLQAATNIDRVVTMFKAARRCHRVLLQDLYMAEVTSAAGKNIPNPRDFYGVRAFMTDRRRYQLLDGKYGHAKIGIHGIAKEKFVMCVRPSMKAYIEKLSALVPLSGGILFYSMWSGYREKDDVKDFLAFMQDKGVAIVDLHTTGHADAAALDALIRHVAPKALLPVHTENAAWFDRYEDCRVIHEKEYRL